MPPSAETRPGPSVLILAPYPFGSVPGQRFRYEQYLGFLADAGVRVDVRSFLPDRVMRYLYKPGHYVGKTLGVLEGFLRRFLTLLVIGRYDYIFIYREASPIGPPIIEWCLFALGGKVIFDFDDAIFIESTSRFNRWVARLKWPDKVPYLTKHSYKVTVCNQYLADWAGQFNTQVVILPTTIDSSYHRSSRQDRGRRSVPVIGWTGSNTTAPYLELVRPALVALQREVAFEFHVICDVDPGFAELERYRFVKWRQETEIADLDQIDIGLMPVPDGTWEQGKVGFKGIQYSAMGIVPVVSSTGSGPEVVDHGRTGLVVDNTTEAWQAALGTLVRTPHLIAAYGTAAREKVLGTYSVIAQAPNYVRLFG
jgi:glycosyltransferase involved in cell wall biosynthesis